MSSPLSSCGSIGPGCMGMSGAYGSGGDKQEMKSVTPAGKSAVPLRLKSVERRQKDAPRLRYELVRS